MDVFVIVYTLEQTERSNELATAAISFLSSSSLSLCLKKIFALRPCNVEWLDMNGKQVTYNTSTPRRITTTDRSTLLCLIQH